MNVDDIIKLATAAARLRCEISINGGEILLTPLPDGRPESFSSRLKGSVWRSLREIVLLRDNHRCTYCGGDGAGSPLHCDHIVPISKGGQDTLENLTTACSTCNTSKGNKDLESWRATLWTQNS